jgi:glycosyltransferase involved in cell wall biosynthesis
MPASDAGRAVDGRHVTFLVPGSIDGRTGGYEYDRRIVAELRARGWTVDVRETDHPRVVSGLGGGQLVVIDGLALASIADPAREGARLKLVPLVHMPGASGTDEHDVLNAAARVIVTGHTPKQTLVTDGFDANRIVIVEPGTDRAEVSPGSGRAAVLLLSVGNVTVGKGYETLVYSLHAIPERNWSLTIGGSVTRDPEYVSRLHRIIRNTKLESRIHLAGELGPADVARALDEADVFVLATVHETYGMAVAEAIARGVPVVATATGEIPSIVGDGGIVVPLGNARALSKALSAIVRDGELRERLRQGALRARDRLRTWTQAGDEMAAILENVARG